EYDTDGRLKSLQHSQGIDHPIAGYSWTYYDDGTVKDFTFSDPVHRDESAHYDYDADQQLTAATRDYPSDISPNESYAYDGNQTQYTIGSNNEITNDGTYTYEYDPNGNRTKRTTIATQPNGNGDGTQIPVEITKYTYDYRNRLTEVDVY